MFTRSDTLQSILSGTVPHAVVPHLSGAAGAHQTVRHMREIVRAYRIDPRMRAIAASALSFVAPKDKLGEIQALMSYVRSNVRYTQDINEVETLQTPDATLKIGIGDCDDMSVLLATLLETIGYRTKFKLTSYQSRIPEHVMTLVEVHFGAEDWIPLDPTEYAEINREPPGALTEWVENI